VPASCRNATSRDGDTNEEIGEKVDLPALTTQRDRAHLVALGIRWGVVH
jgi:hypothetical protein